jgi:hypothetical protein
MFDYNNCVKLIHKMIFSVQTCYLMGDHLSLWWVSVVYNEENYDLLLYMSYNQSQCPCYLKHEISSSAQTLGLWVWISLKAWMYVSVFSMLMLSYVGSGLVTGWSPIQGVLPTVCKLHNFIIHSEWELARGGGHPVFSGQCDINQPVVGWTYDSEREDKKCIQNFGKWVWKKR